MLMSSGKLMRLIFMLKTGGIISILDSFLIKIVNWKVQNSMTADDFIEVLVDACERTGLDRSNMPKLISDRGAVLISVSRCLLWKTKRIIKLI